MKVQKEKEKEKSMPQTSARETSMSQRNGVQKRERNKHSAPKTESFKKTLQHNSEKREFK